MTARACCRCRQFIDSAALVLVGVPFANSGPGGPAAYACLPCACVYATSPLAPDWIGEEIERTRARLAGGEWRWMGTHGGEPRHAVPVDARSAVCGAVVTPATVPVPADVCPECARLLDP